MEDKPAEVTELRSSTAERDCEMAEEGNRGIIRKCDKEVLD